jgi:hypothetical protein
MFGAMLIFAILCMYCVDASRDVNGAPKPDYPWGIPLLGLGYGLKQIPMGIDLE